MLICTCLSDPVGSIKYRDRRTLSFYPNINGSLLYIDSCGTSKIAESYRRVQHSTPSSWCRWRDNNQSLLRVFVYLSTCTSILFRSVKHLISSRVVVLLRYCVSHSPLIHGSDLLDFMMIWALLRRTFSVSLLNHGGWISQWMYLDPRSSLIRMLVSVWSMIMPSLAGPPLCCWIPVADISPTNQWVQLGTCRSYLCS